MIRPNSRSGHGGRVGSTLPDETWKLKMNKECFVFSCTLPETNSSPLKIGLPKRKLVFQSSIFRGYVSFRECMLTKDFFV